MEAVCEYVTRVRVLFASQRRRAKVRRRCCPCDAEFVYLDVMGFLLIIIEMRMLTFVCPQVYIRILDNEWNVYRRYTEFRELHNQLRAQFPQVDTFNFPPKKALGNKVSGRFCSGSFHRLTFDLIY